MGIEDSVTYQLIVEKGMIKAERKTLIRQGTKKFEAPPEAVLRRIEAIDDQQRLERLLDRVLDASSWDQLLAEDGPGGG